MPEALTQLAPGDQHPRGLADQAGDVAIDRALRHFELLRQRGRRGGPRGAAKNLDDLKQPIGATDGILTPADRMLSAGLYGKSFRRRRHPRPDTKGASPMKFASTRLVAANIIKWLERVERDGSRQPVGRGGHRASKLMPHRDLQRLRQNPRPAPACRMRRIPQERRLRVDPRSRTLVRAAPNSARRMARVASASTIAP